MRDGRVDESAPLCVTPHGSYSARGSGEPYIVHPLDAALTVASLKLDANTVRAVPLPRRSSACGLPPDADWDDHCARQHAS